MEHTKGELLAEYSETTEMLTLRHMEAGHKLITVALFLRPNEREAFVLDRLVKCWNCHDELLEALRELTAYATKEHDSLGDFLYFGRELVTKTRLIIAKAEE